MQVQSQMASNSFNRNMKISQRMSYTYQQSHRW